MLMPETTRHAHLSVGACEEEGVMAHSERAHIGARPMERGSPAPTGLPPYFAMTSPKSSTSSRCSPSSMTPSARTSVSSR
jgi:hypothetical protein